MTIVRQEDAELDASDSLAAAGIVSPGAGLRHALKLSKAGGMTGMVVEHETLDPGSPSAGRQWSERADEFIFVLNGEVTVLEDDGTHTLGPGDSAFWPAGIANAHAVHNRSGTPCSLLKVRTRVADDVQHFPEIGIRGEFSHGKWRIIHVKTGKVLNEEKP
jgi:uncharacterized cupin superfamily protein